MGHIHALDHTYQTARVLSTTHCNLQSDSCFWVIKESESSNILIFLEWGWFLLFVIYLLDPFGVTACDVTMTMNHPTLLSFLKRTEPTKDQRNMPISTAEGILIYIVSLYVNCLLWAIHPVAHCSLETK